MSFFRKVLNIFEIAFADEIFLATFATFLSPKEKGRINVLYSFFSTNKNAFKDAFKIKKVTNALSFFKEENARFLSGHIL